MSQYDQFAPRYELFCSENALKRVYLLLWRELRKSYPYLEIAFVRCLQYFGGVL